MKILLCSGLDSYGSSAHCAPLTLSRLVAWVAFAFAALMPCVAQAHTDQEYPASVEVMPQRTYLTVLIGGNGSDLSDAISVSEHDATSKASSLALETADPDVRANVDAYLLHHLLLSQSGRRLEGRLQTLALHPDEVDKTQTEFEATYRYERDPTFAAKPLVVSSILFDFLTKSATIVSLEGTGRTLKAGEDTQFEGAVTLPSLTHNVFNWASRGAAHLVSGYEPLLFFVALLCAVAYLPPPHLPLAVVGFAFMQGAGLAFSLARPSALSPHLVGVGLALSVVVMGVYAWWMARQQSAVKSGVGRGFVPLAALLGMFQGIAIGPPLLAQGLPQEGLIWCIGAFVAGSLTALLAASGAGLWLLRRLRTRYEHSAQYGGLSWPRLLQWTCGALCGVGGFWLWERLAG